MRRKILVADDDRLTRDLLKAVLERADYEVVLAEDGASAVEKAASEKPDLVIADGLLPKMHGFLACKAIKELSPAPKVILLTGIYTKPTYKWEVIDEYGADDLLTKPAKSATLLACLEKHLASVPVACRPAPMLMAVPSTPSEPASVDNSDVLSFSLSSGVAFSEPEMDEVIMGLTRSVA